MRLGVLSDPHRRSDFQKLAIDKLIDEGVEVLIHAGDFCIEENLELLKNSGLPYVAVFGNNDSHLLGLSAKYNIHKEPYYFKIKDLKVKLMHLPFYLTPDSNLVIFGHTHHFETQKQNGTIFLNPGEICAREKPISEMALLDTKKDEVIRFFRDIDSTLWSSKVFKF